MKSAPSLLSSLPVLTLAALVLPCAHAAVLPGKVYPFPVYTNHPPGRQLSGVYTATTTPALPADVAATRFKLPPGFEARVFAAEPEVVNPVGMTWDDRGRLWVVELYEYPMGSKPGEKPRDRIKILEDTDADGKADKITVFADGLNLATGVLYGDGGAYVGAAPDLLFLKDTNGDDVADERRTLMTGFGLEDRHELLNGFVWGPDGSLFMTHGVFTHSKVRAPDGKAEDAVTMNAAVARFHPRKRTFEVYADGTSNPWGVDFDRAGNAFVSACVIDHLFHMAPGGVYVRQGGTPTHPYAYELLPSIVDHKHFRAAYCGINIYQGDQYPVAWRGHVFMGNIHQSAINHDRLTPNGSSFKASGEQDFLVADDGWFRPVSLQTGPDGALWVADWYDKYPCYQNANADPLGVDREYGRIWRVVHVGDQKGKPVPSRPSPGMNLAALTTTDLVRTLDHANVWHRRTAQRILQERRDPAALPLLERLATSAASPEGRLAALWTLHSSDQLSESTLDRLASHADAPVRTWVARFTGERRIPSEAVRDRLTTLAQDPDPSVRLGVATALRQFVSGSLTVNTPPPPGMEDLNLGSVAEPLIRASKDAQDPLIPFLLWMAMEPIVPRESEAVLRWLAENGGDTLPLSGRLTTKVMRRFCDLNRTELIDQAVEFLQATVRAQPALAIAALDGLLEGLKGRALLPSQPVGPIVERLTSAGNADVQERVRRLGTLWGDSSAIQATFRTIENSSESLAARRQAVQSLRQIRIESARDLLLKVVTNPNPDPLVIDAINVLGDIGGDVVPETLVARWRTLPSTARRAAADALAARRNWARVFLTALEQKTIATGDVPASALRALVNHRDDYVRNNAARAIGKVREADPDKLRVIAEKRKVVLAGVPDMAAGREIAAKTCLVCHKFHGEGADVGPDLTGVGRSTLQALLHNVIHPNEIIGKGYEAVEVETKDGRVVSGRLVEDTDTRLKLLSAGPKEDIVAKSDIASQRVTELSLMPDGLEQMPDADFRNMIWYILNPPQDNRPLTPELRRELLGDEAPGSAAIPEAPADEESVALWNPAWRVRSAVTADAPIKLPEFAGRYNVLRTHPYAKDRPAVLERLFHLQPGQQAALALEVGAAPDTAWELRVLIDGKPVLRERIQHSAAQAAWKHLELDLAPYRDRETVIRLEQHAVDGPLESAYWARAEIEVADAQRAALR